MDELQKAPINVQATLLANTMKINALIDSLSEESRIKYDASIQEVKEITAEAFKNILSSEDIQAFKDILG